VSGGFWEERHAKFKVKVKVKAKVKRTVQLHEAVSKSPYFLSWAGGEVQRGMRVKCCAEQGYLVIVSCLFFAGADLGRAGKSCLFFAINSSSSRKNYPVRLHDCWPLQGEDKVNKTDKYKLMWAVADFTSPSRKILTAATPCLRAAVR
jgi:hypothetical protein